MELMELTKFVKFKTTIHFIATDAQINTDFH